MNLRRRSRPSDLEVTLQLLDDAPVSNRVWYLVLVAVEVLALVALVVDYSFGDAPDAVGFTYLAVAFLAHLLVLALAVARGATLLLAKVSELEAQVRDLRTGP